MSAIAEHRPKVFEPKDYEVIGYFDNKPPGFYPGGDIQAWKEYMDWWRAELKRWDFAHTRHACNHCGQTIRWVAVVHCSRTGENLAFGTQCAENRLCFASRSEFRLQFIQDKGGRVAAMMRNAKLEAECLDKFPAFAELRALWMQTDQFKCVAWNSFVNDVMHKFEIYHGVSEGQANAVVGSFIKTMDFMQRKQEEAKSIPDVPEGKGIRFEGEVISMKWQDGPYGEVAKMLVKDTRGFRIWGSVPTVLFAEGFMDGPFPGNHLAFVANTERSKGDSKFGFFKRPRKIEILSKGNIPK